LTLAALIRRRLLRAAINMPVVARKAVHTALCLMVPWIQPVRLTRDRKAPTPLAERAMAPEWATTVKATAPKSLISMACRGGGRGGGRRTGAKPRDGIT